MNSVVVGEISGIGGARHRPSSSSSSSSHPLAPVCVFSTCSLCAFLGLMVLDLVKSSTTFHVFVACVCLSTCAMTTVIDPGIVLPKRNTSARASGIEEGKGEVDAEKEEDEDEGEGDAREERSSRNTRYCETCKIFKPKRSSHCRQCNVCVRGFDHHCGALNTCIGEKNVLFFVAFIVTEAY